MKKKIISLLMIISISVLCGCEKKDEHIEVSEDMQASVQESESENVIQEEITYVADGNNDTDDNIDDESDSTQDVEEDKRDFDESDFDENFFRCGAKEDENGVCVYPTINIIGELSEEECYEFTRLFQNEIVSGFLLGTYDSPQYANLYLVYEGAQKENVDVKSDTREMEERGWDFGVRTYTIQEVDEHLKSLTGYVNAEFEEPLHVQEYNNENVVICYGPFFPFWPNCGGGYVDGNVYTLLFYDPKTVIKLEKQEDGSFRILSNTYYDSPYRINYINDN